MTDFHIRRGNLDTNTQRGEKKKKTHNDLLRKKVALYAPKRETSEEAYPERGLRRSQHLDLGLAAYTAVRK